MKRITLLAIICGLLCTLAAQGQYVFKAGTTSQSINVFIVDNAQTGTLSGGGITGLVFNTSSLTGYYKREGGSSTAITLATLANATSAFSSGGFIAVDGTNMPGVYRLDLPDAAIAAGAKFVVVNMKGAANMATVTSLIRLTTTDDQDAVRGGMTALPNANAAASGGLLINGTNTAAAITAGSLTLTGLIDSGTFNVAGIVNSGSFSNTGTLSAGTFTITNGITAATLSTSGNATFGAGFTIAGSTNFNGIINTGTLNNTGTIAAGTLAVTNVLSTGSLNITNGLISGTLSTGTATVGTLNVANGSLTLGSLTIQNTTLAALTIGAGTVSGGLTINGSSAGPGLRIAGGSVSGNAIELATTDGNGIDATGVAGTGKAGLKTLGILNTGSFSNTGTISAGTVAITNGISAASLSITNGFTVGTFSSGTFTFGTLALTNASNLSGLTVGTATNVTNRVTGGGGTFDNVGSVVTGVTVTTNNDKTGYSLSVTPPTAAQIATGVWTDTTAGDFTTALSVGKSVMNGVTLGTGLTVARVTLADTLTTYTGNTPQTGDAFALIGATGSGLTSLAPSSTALSTAQWTNGRATSLDNLDALISSRMATFTYTPPPTVAAIRAEMDSNSTKLTSIKTVTDALNTGLELDGSVYRFTINALEQAPAGGGGGGGFTADDRTLLGKIGAKQGVRVP